jgi:hypothetical protein
MKLTSCYAHILPILASDRWLYCICTYIRLYTHNIYIYIHNIHIHRIIWTCQNKIILQHNKDTSTTYNVLSENNGPRKDQFYEVWGRRKRKGSELEKTNSDRFQIDLVLVTPRGQIMTYMHVINKTKKGALKTRPESKRLTLKTTYCFVLQCLLQLN